MQQETRREVVDRLLRYVGELNDETARSVAEDLCANAVSSLWLAHPFTEFVMPTDLVVSTVVNQPLYVLPTYFGRVASRDGIVRNLTTGVKIYPLRPNELEQLHPEIGTDQDTSTSDPTNYTISGKVGVAVQVATAGEALEALSSDAGDTDVNIVVEGLDATGQWSTEQFTLHGTTPLALGTWKYVSLFSKSYQAAVTPPTPLTSSRGTVTLRKAIANSARQTLLSYESAREQYQLRLWQTPQSVQRIGIPTIRLPRRIFQDADVIPGLWGPAVFERMHIDWRVNTGELSLEQADTLRASGVEFTRLVGYDNELKPAAIARKRPFGGGR